MSVVVTSILVAGSSFAADDAATRFVSQVLQGDRGHNDHAVVLTSTFGANHEGDGLMASERFIADVLDVRSGSALTPAAAHALPLSATSGRAEEYFVTYVLLRSTINP